jgi:hypothetical protein
VVELCCRITGTGMAPTDLVILAASTFLECDALLFKLKVIALHDAIDKNGQVMNWDSAVCSLKSKYQSLKGHQGLWAPQLATKRRDNEIAVLHATLNKLSVVQVSKGCNNPRCHECDQLGHMPSDCPKKRGSSGLCTPPKEGEPHTKTVKGSSFSWCGICW